MSIYKEIKSSDISVVPVQTNKSFNLSSSLDTIQSIQFRSGSDNLSGSYWDSLRVNFYLSGSDLATEDLRFNNPHYSRIGEHYNPNNTSNPISEQHSNKFHSSGSVLSIPQKYFGEKIKQESFKLTDNSTSETIVIKDDGFGNLYAVGASISSSNSSMSSSDNYVGNIFYNNGVVVITETGSFNNNYWDLDSVTLETESPAMTSENNLPQGIWFKPDGTRYFMVGSQGSEEGVFEYEMSTAWDVSTATYTGNVHNLAPHYVADAWRSVSFNPDGTKMFLTNQDSDQMKAFDLDVGWDLSSFDESDYGSIETFNLDDGEIPFKENKVKGHYFREDGLKLYIVGETNNSAIEYNLSSAFDLTSIGGVSQSYDISSSVSPVETEINGIHFHSDGTRMYTGGNDNNVVYEHRLSTAWDVSTATFYTSKSINSEETQIHDVHWKTDGSKMYIVGHGSDKVHQYNSSASFYTDVTTGNYSLDFESTQTIFVQEYTLKINPNEFNSTNNPTAAKFVSGSKLLRANLTGSNWSPYMTTIRFYSGDDFEPVMIARYPQPIKMRDDLTLIFKIRQDF
tara:strand:+ start:2246 stop:3946 length:1701 start_codon:yes stop_codon:yes gene_type:complete